MKIHADLNHLDTYKKYLKLRETTEEFMNKKGYLKVEVPVLSPALIPESYLEIFETSFNYFDNKKKLYLTPSPELFLKRMLTKGLGDCYYLGKAFRNNEPNSTLHLPEFTMFEFYKVGVPYVELADEILELWKYLAQKLYRKNEITYKGKKLSFEKWERLTVVQAFEKYSQINESTLFNHALFIKRAMEKGYKTEGFTYQDIFSQMIAQEIEPNLGKNGYPTLLYDYPSEMSSLAKLSKDGNTARRIEFYIDGVEIGGCCEELNDWKEQEKRFTEHVEKRKQAGLIDHSVDKGFIEALQYGLPDCTGAGIGFDRLAMIFADTDSIDALQLITFSS